ncbi:MAG: hypothetical protein OD918_09300 [Gammaproteobacteria bacterium]
MADEQNKEWRKLTFAQRAGKAPLPDALEVGKLSQQFRLAAWECVDASIERGWYFHEDEGWSFGSFQPTDEGRFWKAFVRAYFMEVHEIPHDKLPVTNADFFWKRLHSTMLNGDVWDVLTVFEYMLRTPGMPHALRVGIEHALEKSTYFLDESAQPICIMPSVSEEGKKAMRRSLDDLQKAGMPGAVEHLRNSARRINEGEYANSLGESILAVEWVAGKIAGKDATLGDALKILAKENLLKNAQLKSGFEQLYAYTNNVPGARHANAIKATVFEGTGTPPPEKDDALFMYGACASFAAYLSGKQRKIKTPTRPPDAT